MPAGKSKVYFQFAVEYYKGECGDGEDCEGFEVYL